MMETYCDPRILLEVQVKGEGLRRIEVIFVKIIDASNIVSKYRNLIVEI